MIFARRENGFTLVELLAAVAIILVLAGIALAIVLNTLGLWHRVQGNISGAAEVRLALDFLERDLQGSVRRSDANHWLVAELQNAPAALRDGHGWLVDAPINGSIKPATDLSLDAVPAADGGVATARFGFGGAWLRFFSLDNTGLPSAVSYQMIRRRTGGAGSPNDAAPHYLLFRTAATDTLDRGYDLISGYDDVLPAPADADVLADNVVDFGVWLYGRSAGATGGLQRIFPSGASATTRYAAQGNGTLAEGNSFPDVADVMVRILTDEGALLLANLESGRGRLQPPSDAEWWSLVEAHSIVFVRRIELRGSGPWE